VRLSEYRTLLLVPACFLLATATGWAQSPYRMQGVVTDADTQIPVANATVQVFIPSDVDPTQRIRKARSDDEGRYAIELPAGHGRALTLLPPAGYCSAKSNDYEVFATSIHKPIFTKNYEVRKGVAIRIAVRPSDKVAIPPKTYVSIGRQQGNAYINGFCELELEGNGTVTLPELSGKFDVFCGDEKRKLMAPHSMSVDFDKGFDPGNVMADVTRQDDGATIVRDANGRAATLRGCDVTISENEMSIAIDVNVGSSNNLFGQLRGRIVDVHGDGIEGASLAIAFHSKGGSATSRITATTDNTGRFAVGVPQLRADQKVSLVVTRDGYAGMDTEPMDLAISDLGIADVEPIQIDVGCSVRVRVVGPDESPLHGAVVEPLNDYASRTRIVRTGPDGECQLTDLAAGLMRVSAQFGTLATRTKIPLDQGENQLVVLKLTPTATVLSTTPPESSPALAAGTAAPEWNISEWTDGKDRKLSDYRGKVVVLDFWGVWCGPCIHAIPAMKELHDRYKDRDVVFLGVHTAGTDMTLVKRLLKQQQWNATVGLDTGDDIVTGATVRAYAVRGFPTVIVIDPNGRITFNSGDVPKDRDAIMRDMQAVAESAGLPWPLDKDATEEQTAERMTRMLVVMFGGKIEQALKVNVD